MDIELTASPLAFLSGKNDTAAVEVCECVRASCACLLFAVVVVVADAPLKKTAVFVVCGTSLHLPLLMLTVCGSLSELRHMAWCGLS
jgi:hypothetical protein